MAAWNSGAAPRSNEASAPPVALMETTLPLVLLPGLHGTCRLMAELVTLLARKRPVVTIDYPSDPLLDFDAYVGFVRARSPAGPFAVLGESFSGPIAIALTHREPRVAGLILASTFASFPLPSSITRSVVALVGLPVPARYPARALAGRGAAPRLVDALNSIVAGLPKTLIRQRTRIALETDTRMMLASTSCPLLCLSGGRDRLTGRHALASITSARPDAQVRRLDAGHMLLETHAEEATDAIEGFLTALERPPPHSG